MLLAPADGQEGGPRRKNMLMSRAGDADASDHKPNRAGASTAGAISRHTSIAPAAGKRRGASAPSYAGGARTSDPLVSGASVTAAEGHRGAGAAHRLVSTFSPSVTAGVRGLTTKVRLTQQELEKLGPTTADYDRDGQVQGRAVLQCGAV